MSAKIYNFPTPEQQLGVFDGIRERPSLLDVAVGYVQHVQQQEHTNTPLTAVSNHGGPLADPALAVPEEVRANVPSLTDYRNRANDEARSAADSLDHMSNELRMAG